MCASEVFVCASALEGHIRVLDSIVLYAHVILFVCWCTRCVKDVCVCVSELVKALRPAGLLI